MSQPTDPSRTANKSISPADRQKYDQIFMQVILSVQQDVQASRPPQSGALAAMFHKEQLQDALQGCAMLIAGWNAGIIDAAGTVRTARALRSLGRSELAERVEGLIHIDDDGTQTGG
ncbi:hypothetical protein [Deinococcus ruber]|uniref:Uncharacterized protein n=1 Tax=Deinococcus ruber TaxID=1848197 RepID=A0A918F808_9DEIO|nr:hypothetical protein [Deinococcus ruber]GGR09025.1 hypothetical protein GCM10008957_22350 [Deinococcus ruber]